MIGVVLGTIYIGVHLEAAVDIYQGQTGLVGPGGTVEALHHPAGGQVGPVVDLKTAGQVPLTCQLYYLAESLEAVEGPSLIVSQDRDTVLRDSEQIGSGERLHSGLHGLLGVEVHSQADIFLISLVQEVHVTAEQSVPVHHIYTARYIQHRALRSYLHHMRDRVDLTVQGRLSYRVTAPHGSGQDCCCHDE